MGGPTEADAGSTRVAAPARATVGLVIRLVVSIRLMTAWSAARLLCDRDAVM